MLPDHYVLIKLMTFINTLMDVNNAKPNISENENFMNVSYMSVYRIGCEDHLNMQSLIWKRKPEN